MRSQKFWVGQFSEQFNFRQALIAHFTFKPNHATFAPSSLIETGSFQGIQTLTKAFFCGISA